MSQTSQFFLKTDSIPNCNFLKPFVTPNTENTEILSFKTNVFSSLSNHVKVGYTDLPVATQENTYSEICVYNNENKNIAINTLLDDLTLLDWGLW